VEGLFGGVLLPPLLLLLLLLLPTPTVMWRPSLCSVTTKSFCIPKLKSDAGKGTEDEGGETGDTGEIGRGGGGGM